MEKKKSKKIVTIILCTVLGVCIAVPASLFGGYYILSEVGKSRIPPAVVDPEIIDKIELPEDGDNAISYDEGKTVTYKGTKYVYNENIVPIAFMGIDTPELGSDLSYSDSVGQADTNMVLALDAEKGTVAMIVIPRDSMVDMNVYDSAGNVSGIENMQLCLSYSYGDGKEKSSENTLECIERILCGIDISTYISLDLSGICELNDAVGGVELVALETVADFTEGQKVHLWGELARNYVQRRDTEKFNSDALRRERQLQYAKAFAAKVMDSAKKDFSVVTKLYNVMKEYSCTNLDLSTFTYLATKALASDSINFDNIHVLQGEAVMGDKFVEVYLDEAAVLETVLNVFYTPVE